MEYAIIGGVIYLVFNWYQNTVVKPIEEAKEFIEENIIEPVHDLAEDAFNDVKMGAEKSFEEVKEGAEKTGDFTVEVAMAGANADKERFDALISATKTGAKHTKPITKEVEHSFDDGIENVKEDSKDVPAIAKDGFGEVKKGNVVEGVQQITYSGKVANDSIANQATEGAKKVGSKVADAGKDVGHELRKGATATKKQAEKTGNAIGRFFGF